MNLEQLSSATIAVPGLMTAAYLSLRLCVGDVKTVVFHSIKSWTRLGAATSANLLIHEGLTYSRGISQGYRPRGMVDGGTGLPSA
jgi:predicted solute-binding protein